MFGSSTKSGENSFPMKKKKKKFIMGKIWQEILRGPKGEIDMIIVRSGELHQKRETDKEKIRKSEQPRNPQN